MLRTNPQTLQMLSLLSAVFGLFFLFVPVKKALQFVMKFAALLFIVFFIGKLIRGEI